MTIRTESPTGTLTETDLAESAYESIRAINHRTIHTRPIPAPEIYTILGNLKLAGPGLGQALHQLALALRLSLTTHDVYEDDGSDPVTRAESAIDDMQAAASHATSIGDLLSSAQTTLAGQAYHEQEVSEP